MFKNVGNKIMKAAIVWLVFWLLVDLSGAIAIFVIFGDSTLFIFIGIALLTILPVVNLFTAYLIYAYGLIAKNNVENSAALKNILKLLVRKSSNDNDDVVDIKHSANSQIRVEKTKSNTDNNVKQGKASKSNDVSRRDFIPKHTAYKTQVANKEDVEEVESVTGIDEEIIEIPKLDMSRVPKDLPVTKKCCPHCYEVINKVEINCPVCGKRTIPYNDELSN